MAQTFGRGGVWSHELDLTLDRLAGQSESEIVRFPSWLSDPNARPIGSRPLSTATVSADGHHVFLTTSGGGVRISGVWEASLRVSPSGNPARLLLGTRARVQGRPAPASHLDRATHVFGSPDGRYLVVDPRAGFWVEDTRTHHVRLLRMPAQPDCVISQSGWAAGGRQVMFVQSCSLNGGSAFRSTLCSVGLNGGAPRRLLTAIDRGPDAIALDTVYRCVGCGFTPGS